MGIGDLEGEPAWGFLSRPQPGDLTVWSNKGVPML